MTSLGSIIIERSFCKLRLIRRARHESLARPMSWWWEEVREAGRWCRKTARRDRADEPGRLHAMIVNNRCGDDKRLVTWCVFYNTPPRRNDPHWDTAAARCLHPLPPPQLRRCASAAAADDDDDDVDDVDDDSFTDFVTMMMKVLMVTRVHWCILSRRHELGPVAFYQSLWSTSLQYVFILVSYVHSYWRL